MAKCDACGTTILFGGVRAGEYRFCNQTCHERGWLLSEADRVPEAVVAEKLRDIHQGRCPRCGGEGPVDVHTSHSVFSALVVTTWKSKPMISCRSCGTKSKLLATGSTLALGWWGFPWGLIMTPIQVVRNVGGLMSPPDPEQPSPQLEKTVRLMVAAESAGPPA